MAIIIIDVLLVGVALSKTLHGSLPVTLLATQYLDPEKAPEVEALIDEL